MADSYVCSGATMQCTKADKEGDDFKDKIANLKNALNMEMKFFASSSISSLKGSLFEIGKEYLNSLKDSVGTLISGMSYNIKNL